MKVIIGIIVALIIWGLIVGSGDKKEEDND